MAFKFQNMIIGLIVSEEFRYGIHFILSQKYPFKGKNEQSPWLLLINSAWWSNYMLGSKVGMSSLSLN